MTVHRRSAPRPVVQQSQNIVSMVEILMVCVIAECSVASLEHVLLCWYCDIYRVNNECLCVCWCAVLLREISLVYRVNDRLRSGWLSTLHSPLIGNLGRLLLPSTSNGCQCLHVSGVSSRVSASVLWCCAGVIVVTFLSLRVFSVHRFNLQRWLWTVVHTWTSWLLRTVICVDFCELLICWNFWNCYGYYLCVCNRWQYETIERKSYNFSLSLVRRLVCDFRCIFADCSRFDILYLFCFTVSGSFFEFTLSGWV